MAEASTAGKLATAASIASTKADEPEAPPPPPGPYASDEELVAAGYAPCYDPSDPRSREEREEAAKGEGGGPHVAPAARRETPASS